MSETPIPMILYCPNCGRQHIDAPDEAKGWSNPDHKSHACPCGCTWRPADVCTTGVAAIKTCGKNDNWIFDELVPANIAQRKPITDLDAVGTHGYKATVEKWK